MNATNKLRFVERTVKEYSDKHQSYQPKKIRVLQQWWEPVETTCNQAAPDFAIKGEWRDVPLEAIP